MKIKRDGIREELRIEKEGWPIGSPGLSFSFIRYRYRK